VAEKKRLRGKASKKVRIAICSFAERANHSRGGMFSLTISGAFILLQQVGLKWAVFQFSSINPHLPRSMVMTDISEASAVRRYIHSNEVVDILHFSRGLRCGGFFVHTYVSPWTSCECLLLTFKYVVCDCEFLAATFETTPAASVAVAPTTTSTVPPLLGRTNSMVSCVYVGVLCCLQHRCLPIPPTSPIDAGTIASQPSLWGAHPGTHFP